VGDSFIRSLPHMFIQHIVTNCYFHYASNGQWLILDRKIHSKRAKDSELYIAIAKKCFNGIISVTSKLGIGGVKTSCCLSECIILKGRNRKNIVTICHFFLVSVYVWYCCVCVYF
jgi:hypothetical protein